MSVVRFQVEYRRFLPGCAAGLAEKTALVELSVQGDLTGALSAEQRIRAAAPTLCPGEPLYGVAETDWPDAFLLSGPADVDDAALGWLGTWVVALTVAIQRWGRDPVLRGRLLAAGQGRLRLAVPWHRTDFFDHALAAATQLITEWLPACPDTQPAWLTWLKGDAATTDPLAGHFGDRWPHIQAGGLRPNTLRFIEAASRRGIPFEIRPSFVQFGWGVNLERMDLGLTGRTSWIGMAMARNKRFANQTLGAAGLPVPRLIQVSTAQEALQAADELGWPVVIKPLDQDGATAVTPGIGDPAHLCAAFEAADRASPGAVVVEQHCPGEDYRFLVVGGRVLHVVRRTAAHVVGDGLRTVRLLVDQVNEDPRRGTQRYSLLRALRLDADAVDLLAEQALSPDSVPPAGQRVRLSRTANISSGGTAEDVTASTHPENIALAERAARIIGLDIAGIDFLCSDINRSWREVGAAICEVNGQPGFRPHWLADPERDINGEVLDILFEGRAARIPTAAVTGTNGKTTTAEMLYRIWMSAGRRAAVCTTAVLRIGDQIVSTENLSGQPGGRIMLNDPGVEAAVLEMPRKGLIYYGHPCDRYEVAALLNVQDDHLGVDGIDTLEQMAELKAEVLQRATRAVVVNAEDPLCLAMRGRASAGRHILVARNPDVGAIAEHRRGGGEAVFIDTRRGRRRIILATGSAETELMAVDEVPATMDGLLVCNESNALFAAGLAWAHGIDHDAIRRGLSAFRNSADQNPGRYNFVNGLPFDVVVDFAHNPDGVRAVCAVATARPVTGRRLLCGLNVGNRHPAHLDALAGDLAAAFDDFVLGCDPALVGGCPEYAGDDPAAAMLGKWSGLLWGRGVDPARITIEADRGAALRDTLDRARAGDLVVLLADWDEAQQAIDQWRSRAGHT